MSKWLTYTPTSGHKNGTIDVTASLNDTNAVRSAILNISNTQYSVRKKVGFKQRSSAMPIILTLNKTNFTWEGGDFVVNVQCQGAWSLDAPVNITLDTYEGFGNASVSGHLSYNFGSDSVRFTISGDSGRIYYDSIDLTEGGLDATNNTVYRYTAYEYNTNTTDNPNIHIWGNAYMRAVQAGFYKGYKNGVEVPFRHLTDQYTGDSAVIWDDIIDSVDIRYISLDGRYAEDMHYYNNTLVRRIDGISNLVTLLPYHYECESCDILSTSGWRLEFAYMGDCEYADMKNLIPQDGWWDMGCMFQGFSGVLDCSTWSFRHISNMDDFIGVGGGALNIRSMERNGVRAAINSTGSVNLFGRVISADSLNPVRHNVFSSGDKVYYPDVYESEWLPYVNYYTGVEFVPYDKDNFILFSSDTIKYNHEKKTTKALPVFSSSDWTLRSDSSWFSVEKVRDLGFRIHLKDNIGDKRVGHIYATNEQGLTATLEIVQDAMFYIAYTTVDNEPLNIKSMNVYKYATLDNSNTKSYETSEMYVDGEWRLYFIKEPERYDMTGINGQRGSRIKEFRGASLPCIIRNLYFTNNTDLESVDLENITLWYDVYIPKNSPPRRQPNIFMGCSNLKEMDWEGLSRVDGRTRWYNSTSPSYMDFSNTFNGCTSLEYADITPILMSIKNENHKYVSNGATNMFNGCASLKTINCGEIVCALSGNGIFQGCRSLQTFYGGLIKFSGSEMFNGCTSLKTVTISTDIGRDMFKDCLNLMNIEFKDDYVVSNGESAFENCPSLTTLDLSGGNFDVTTSISRMFYNCSNLNTIKLGVNAYFHYDGKPLDKHYTSLNSWGDAFYGTAGGTIQIPTNATTNKRSGWDIRNQTDHFYPEDKWTVVKY